MAFGCAIGTNSTRIDSAVPPHPLKVTRIERAVHWVCCEWECKRATLTAAEIHGYAIRLATNGKRNGENAHEVMKLIIYQNNDKHNMNKFIFIWFRCRRKKNGYFSIPICMRTAEKRRITVIEWRCVPRLANGNYHIWESVANRWTANGRGCCCWWENKE